MNEENTVEVDSVENNNESVTENLDNNASNSSNENNTNDVDWKAEAEKWKELSRKNESTAKENYRNFTELNEKFSALQSKLEEANNYKQDNLNLLKRAVVAETGLPSELSERLRGEDEESLKKDASDLLTLFGKNTKKQKPISSQGSDDNDSAPMVIKTKEDYARYYKK